MAGLCGGCAGAGATMRTVVNIRAGGKTPISGVTHSIALTTIVLGEAFAWQAVCHSRQGLC